MCWDNDDPAELYVTRHRVASKRHRCDEGCDIDPGDRYLVVVAKSDGYFSTYKLCGPCETLSAAIGKHCRRREPWSTDPPLGGMSEAIEEEVRWGEFDEDEVTEKWKLRRLSVEFDKRVQAAGLRRIREAGVRT